MPRKELGLTFVISDLANSLPASGWQWLDQLVSLQQFIQPPISSAAEPWQWPGGWFCIPRRQGSWGKQVVQTLKDIHLDLHRSSALNALNPGMFAVERAVFSCWGWARNLVYCWKSTWFDSPAAGTNWDFTTASVEGSKEMGTQSRSPSAATKMGLSWARRQNPRCKCCDLGTGRSKHQYSAVTQGWVNLETRCQCCGFINPSLLNQTVARVLQQ